MYDVRGIQDYIFLTTKLRDAIGASAIVEGILYKALDAAVKQASEKGLSFDYELEWEDTENNTFKVFAGDKDIQVLYIGGGNAFVTYRDKALCEAINRLMSKYVISSTYSLQLAIAVTEITGDYIADNSKINKEMSRVKADMTESSPIGAFPIMDVELATGLPLASGCKDYITNEAISKETALKREAEKAVRKSIKNKRQKLDDLIEEKGTDSTLAVVHIDGNNMGLRIRELMSNEHDYTHAINKIRSISYSINHSFKEVLDDMIEYFNEKGDKETCMLKVIAGGDDITYICTAKAAVASVEYYVKNITGKTMTGDPKDVEKYGFSICAGIAYIRSHFPFSIGYQVAEACCESAKTRAKREKSGNKVGNFFDYQFCKNVQSQNMKLIRKNEYQTHSGEYLMLRPYEIGGDKAKPYNFEKLRSSLTVFSRLKDQSSEKKETAINTIPRSHAKTIRNTYSLGRTQMSILKSFLESRGWKLPNQTGNDIEFYYRKQAIDGEIREYTAKYYDALELMDDYTDLNDFEKKQEEGISREAAYDEEV